MEALYFLNLRRGCKFNFFLYDELFISGVVCNTILLMQWKRASTTCPRPLWCQDNNSGGVNKLKQSFPINQHQHQLFSYNLQTIFVFIYGCSPILGVWRGGSLLASSPDFESMCVTKAEYEELGSARCRRRFFHWRQTKKHSGIVFKLSCLYHLLSHV